MVECPVCEEEMEESDNEFIDDTYLDTTSVTVTLRCSNEKCPLSEGDLEVDYTYNGMINQQKKDIERMKDEYSKTKFVEGI